MQREGYLSLQHVVEVIMLCLWDFERLSQCHFYKSLLKGTTCKQRPLDPWTPQPWTPKHSLISSGMKKVLWLIYVIQFERMSMVPHLLLWFAPPMSWSSQGDSGDHCVTLPPPGVAGVWHSPCSYICTNNPRGSLTCHSVPTLIFWHNSRKVCDPLIDQCKYRSEM